VSNTQLIFSILTVVVLLGLAGYYGWCQRQTLVRVRTDSSLSVAERNFLSGQARRRIVGCLFMALFAVQLVGLFPFDQRLTALGQAGQEARERGEDPSMTPEQKTLLRQSVAYVIGLLLVLLILFAIAGMEFFAIRRFSILQMRQIQADRREMIADETARLRRERDDHA
jgi:hypothetical protein